MALEDTPRGRAVIGFLACLIMEPTLQQEGYIKYIELYLSTLWSRTKGLLPGRRPKG